MSKKEIKVLLLSSTGYAPRWEREAATKSAASKEYNIVLDVMKPEQFYMYLSGIIGHDRLYRKSKEGSEKVFSKTYDAVIPRISGRGFVYGTQIVKHLSENLNTFSTASARGLEISSNKWLCSQYLSKHKLRVPQQVMAYGPSDYGQLIELAGGLPCVGKTVTGSQGAGVFILETPLAASTALVALQKSAGKIILQKFLQSSFEDKPANDLRIWVIGGETKSPKVFAMRRWSLADDFRSNVSISKSGEAVEITEEEKQMAIAAAKALNMGVVGVDLMRDANDNFKPYLLETNGNPGLKIEGITGQNIVGAVLDYVVENYRKGGQEARFMEPTIKENLRSGLNEAETCIRSYSLNPNEKEISKLSKIVHRLKGEVKF